MKLPILWELPDEITERFGERGAGKQRAMVADGHLLLVLHKTPTRDQRKREAIFFWRKPTGEWESSGRGDGLRGLRKHLGEYGSAEERFSEEYEQAETAEDYFRILEEMAPLHHAANNLHATLQAAREGIPDDRDIIDLRDWAYDLERTLDLLYADTKNGLDFHIAKQAEEQARLSLRSVQTANRLNILAAIFFPLTAISSVFGMNLRSGLENAPLLVFWFVFLIGVALGFTTREWVLQGMRARQKR
jgi:hypothetical protein